MFILATAASCVGNTELIQILHKILNQILINRSRDDPAKDKKCDFEFGKCILVLGGDWSWRSTILVVLLQKEFTFVRTAYVNYLT